MNKSELSEIKKQFKTDNYRFSINKIANAYILARGGIREIKYFDVRNFALLPESECELYLENCKKTLGGQLGKGLVEYQFPMDAYEEDMPQSRMYHLLQTELSDKDMVRDYIEKLIDSTDYTADYYITIAHCTYDVPADKKDKEEDIDFDDGEVFNFILLSVNFAALTDIGLFYNEKENRVEKKANTEFQILRAPADGFMFPVFNDRATDINNVLYFTKTPKTPNQQFISSVLGCEYTISSEEEKTRFASILTQTLGDDLNYEVVSNIHEKVREVIAQSASETEMIELGKSEVKHILERSGVSDKKLEDFDSIYEEELGDLSLKPVNMIDTSKLGIKMPDVVVNIKPNGTDKVTTKTISGKKYLMISIDDSIEVNGLDVNP